MITSNQTNEMLKIQAITQRNGCTSNYKVESRLELLQRIEGDASNKGSASNNKEFKRYPSNNKEFTRDSSSNKEFTRDPVSLRQFFRVSSKRNSVEIRENIFLIMHSYLEACVQSRLCGCAKFLSSCIQQIQVFL